MCPRRWWALLGTSPKECRCDKRHTTLCSYRSWCTSCLWTIWAIAGVYRWPQRFAILSLSPPSHLISLWWTVKGQCNSIFAVWLVLSSLPRAKLWGTLSWCLKLAPKPCWSMQTPAIAWQAPGVFFSWKTVQTLLRQVCANVGVCQQTGLGTEGDVLGERVSWHTMSNLNWWGWRDPRTWGEALASPWVKSRWGLTPTSLLLIW